MSDFFIPSVSGTTVTHGSTATKSESLLVNLTDIILNGSFVAISVGVMIGLWVLLKKKMTSSRSYGSVKALKDLSQRDLETQGALPNQLLRDNQAAGAGHAKLSAASMVAHEPLKSPALVALKNLEQALRLKENMNYVAYCGLISDTVRSYLNDYFGLQVSNSSTSQFLNRLPESIIDHTGEILRMCDMIEFSNHCPTQTELDSIYQNSKSLIQQTDRLISSYNF
ncbi:hypothetical protein CMK18_01360 [Candidatus Poribacteria bacterium]|nr:hypothetical protein [Candidatus Poribacteria bacterium]